MARQPAWGVLNTTAGRMLSGIGLLLLAGNVVLLWQTKSWDQQALIASERTRVRSIAAATAGQINGDAHEALAQSIVEKDAFTDWSDAPDDAWLQHIRLAGVVEDVGLASPVYTLRLRDEARRQVEFYPDQVHEDAMEFLATSADAPYWRHTYDYRPEMKAALFDGLPRSTGLYEDEHGSWVSGYAPVRDSLGNIVAILEVDAPLDQIEAVHVAWFRRHAALVGGLALAVLVLLIVVARRLVWGFSLLDRATLRLAAGDLETEIEPKGYSEIVGISERLEEARALLQGREQQLRAFAEGMKRENALLEQGFNAETRRRRNTLLERGDEIAAQVFVAGTAIPARVVDLTYSWTIVQVSPTVTVVRGAPMVLEISVPVDQDTVQLRTVAATVTKTDEALELRLEPREATDQLVFPKRLLTAMNLRESLRARPDPRKPVEVECDFKTDKVTGRVLDLSATGMAVVVECDADALAGWGDTAKLRFSLPGSDTPMLVKATLMRILDNSGSVTLGFTFRFRGRRGSAVYQQAIQTWVEERLEQAPARIISMAS